MDDKVTILRVGDKLSDRFTIPREYKEKIKNVQKICTLPELEMLIIINEGDYSEYKKEASKIKPCIFCKKNINFIRREWNFSRVILATWRKKRLLFYVKNIVR